MTTACLLVPDDTSSMTYTGGHKVANDGESRQHRARKRNTAASLKSHPSNQFNHLVALVLATAVFYPSMLHSRICVFQNLTDHSRLLCTKANIVKKPLFELYSDTVKSSKCFPSKAMIEDMSTKAYIRQEQSRLVHC